MKKIVEMASAETTNVITPGSFIVPFLTLEEASAGCRGDAANIEQFLTELVVAVHEERVTTILRSSPRVASMLIGRARIVDIGGVLVAHRFAVA